MPVDELVMIAGRTITIRPATAQWLGEMDRQHVCWKSDFLESSPPSGLQIAMNASRLSPMSLIRSRSVTLSVAFTTVFMFATSRFVRCEEIDLNLLAEVKEKATPQWKRWEAMQKNAQIAFEWTYTVPASKTSVSSSHIFAIGPSGDKINQIQHKGQKPSRVVANSRYRFKVSELEEGVVGVLHTVELGSERDGLSSEERMIRENTRGIGAAWNAFGMPAWQLVESSEAKIVVVKYVSPGEGDHRWIRIESKFEHLKVLRDPGSVVWIDIDPAADYRIMTTGKRFPDGIRLVQTVNEYQESGFGPVAKRQTTNTVVSGSKVDQTLKVFDTPTICTFSQKEFLLPYYGISEAVLETLHPNPWPRWLLIGFGVLTIAIGAWLVRGRRQPAA